MSSQNWILTAPIAPTLARLAAPNIAAMFIMLATSMAEAWYVGQFGTPALAGLALVFPLFMLTTMLSAGSIGGTVAGAVAQRLGANDRDGAEALAFHAVLLALLAAAAFGVLFLGFGAAIFKGLGASGEILAQALAYSDLLFGGAIALWLANILSSVIRGCGQMQVSARFMIIGSAVQIVAGYLFVLGPGPMPALGIRGAALAAVLGFGFSALLQLIYLLRGRGGLRLRLTGIPVEWRHFANLLRTGLVASISPVSSVASVILITGFVAQFGEAALAGYGIGSRLEFLLIPLIFGIGSASITMVGAHFGAGQEDRGHRIAWTAAFSAAAITGIVGGVLALFPGLWADLFTDVEAVRQTCRDYLRIAGPAYGFFGLGLCLYFASQGARKPLWPVLAGLMRLGLVGIGGSLLLASGAADLDGLFWLIAAGMVLYGVASALSVRLGAWQTRPAPAAVPAD